MSTVFDSIGRNVMASLGVPKDMLSPKPDTRTAARAELEYSRPPLLAALPTYLKIRLLMSVLASNLIVKNQEDRKK